MHLHKETSYGWSLKCAKLFKQKQSTSKPTLVATATNDVSQAELTIVKKKIEKAVKPRKQYNKDIP